VRLLVDSHALIWAADSPSLLGAQARTALGDPNHELLISAATIWELSIKCGLGKLVLNPDYKSWISKAVADLNANLLPITIEASAVQTQLPPHHRDPFDRMLIAQSMAEGLTLVSNDSAFDQYGVQRLW
jgi:PIN domain nuclease of toxin-antitoxin system